MADARQPTTGDLCRACDGRHLLGDGAHRGRRPAATAATAATGGAARPAAAAPPAAEAVPVIIFLKDHATGAGNPVGPAGRLAPSRAAQAHYLARLTRLGATGVHGYRLADAIAARVPASALPGLAASPGVASVIPDSPVAGPDEATASPRVAGRHRHTRPRATVMSTPPGACSAIPQLQPEGLALTGTAAQTAANRPRGRSATPGRT